MTGIMFLTVLFTCCIATHSSTGVSPYCMVYNKDPILPFEYKDKLDLYSDEYLDYEIPLTAPNVCTDAKGTNINQEFSQTLKAMEEQKQEIFSHAKTKIKKAQKHQAKCYNARNAGVPFEIGTKVLKKNLKDLQCKEKLENHFTRPYIITGKSSTGGYYLHDKYSHALKCPIPQQQLVEYFEACKTSMRDSDDDVMNSNPLENTSTPSKNITSDKDETDSAHSPCESDIESLSENDCSCKRSDLFYPQERPMGHSTPIQSQLVIILSKDGACSITSEESSLIDIGVDNPWGNIDVNDIPMELVSDPIASDNEVIIIALFRSLGSRHFLSLPFAFFGYVRLLTHGVGSVCLVMILWQTISANSFLISSLYSMGTFRLPCWTGGTVGSVLMSYSPCISPMQSKLLGYRAWSSLVLSMVTDPGST